MPSRTPIWTARLTIDLQLMPVSLVDAAHVLPEASYAPVTSLQRRVASTGKWSEG
ncbi:hypothetical protein JCM18882A_15810 [Brevibacterium metallidurans]